MQPIVDSHVHIFPDPLGRKKLFSEPWGQYALSSLSRLRSQGQKIFRPISKGLHQAQPMNRVMPEPLRKAFDQLGSSLSLPHLLLEAHYADFAQSMKKNALTHAYVIAHPPYASNQFVLKLSQENPALIPVVNLGHPDSKSNKQSAEEVFQRYIQKGARLLKIHAPADGRTLSSAYYQKLLGHAENQGLPVIIHTGEICNPYLYKNPQLGRVQGFEPWFKKYVNLRFILAHMNFHEPEPAIQLAEKYPNLYLETSWQPSEIIAEAVRRIGAERVLYGSDWPLLGNNISLSLERIQTCQDQKMITAQQAKLVLGQNALKLAGLLPDAKKP